MAFFSSTEYKQNGPNILKTDADFIGLIKNPLKTDTYAQMQAKLIATAPIVAADVTFAASGNDLQVTVAGKSGVDPSGTAALADDLSVVVYSSTTQKVHICQDAANRDVTNGAGDTVNIPNLVAFIREYATV